MAAVSVILPTFNRLPYLRAAVASVLEQSFTDLELLIVDDGSSDGTAEYVAALTDQRVRWIPCAHSGNVGRVRNAGAAAATGSVLTFLDSDDLWLPRKLELQIGAMTDNSRVWSYTRYRHIDADGRQVPARAGSRRIPSGRIARALLHTDATASIVTVALPGTLFEAIGGFNEKSGLREDLEFLVRLACQADAVAIDEDLVLVRDHASRSTRALTAAQSHQMSARTYAVLASSLQDPALRGVARRRRVRHIIASLHARVRSAIGLRRLRNGPPDPAPASDAPL